MINAPLHILILLIAFASSFLVSYILSQQTPSTLKSASISFAITFAGLQIWPATALDPLQTLLLAVLPAVLTGMILSLLDIIAEWKYEENKAHKKV